ncbi:MAG: nuclear transcription factor Y subunit beta, partial [bacterium]
AALPSDTKISKEARECVQECVSEFIAFITCEACEITSAEKRKTINGDDVIKSMRELNFVEYIDNVEHYNKLYRDALKKLETGSDVKEDADEEPERST